MGGGRLALESVDDLSVTLAGALTLESGGALAWEAVPRELEFCVLELGVPLFGRFRAGLFKRPASSLKVFSISFELFLSFGLT